MKQLPKNVLGFRYKTGMPNAAEAIERQLENLVATFGPELVFATLKQSYGLNATTTKRKLPRVG